MVVAWMASRTIRPRKMAALRKAWQFKRRPKGLIRLYFLRGARDEMIGISVFESRAALARYRRTPAERERLAAMRPLVTRVNWAGVYNAEDVRL